MFATDSRDRSSSRSEALDLGLSINGGVYARGSKQPDAVRAPAPAERFTAIRYFFALDAEGRPAWPFRHAMLPGGRVFAQRWRLGSWVYSRELDELWQGVDDRWVEATAPAVASWIERTLMQPIGK